MCMCIWDRPVC